MSQARLTDLLLLLAGGLAAAGCTEPIVPDDSMSPARSDALDAAIEACRPYADKTTACFTEAHGETYGYNYLSQLGYCVAQFGYSDSLGEGCGDAYEDYFACLSNQDCESIVGDTPVDDNGGTDEEEPPTYPCQAEEDALDRACSDDAGEPSPGGTD